MKNIFHAYEFQFTEDQFDNMSNHRKEVAFLNALEMTEVIYNNLREC